MSEFDCTILKNHLTNRLNSFIRCKNDVKKNFIEDVKEISGEDITESMESYKKFLKIKKYVHHKEMMIDYYFILKCLYNQKLIEKMFECVNCKKIQLVECKKDKYIENRDNGIYRIFKNYKNDYFPVCHHCVYDGKSFVTKLNKYFFPVNTISYDKFKKIHFNRKEAKHFRRNYYVPISDEEDSRYDVLSNLGI